MKKGIIIKTRYYEILEDRNNSRKVSLGDILRTTSLLYLYNKDKVTWVGDIPHFEGKCIIGENCINNIGSESILDKIHEYLKK